MDARQFREAAHAAIDQIIDYYENIESLRVASDVIPGYLSSRLPAACPENSESWPAIQRDIADKIIPGLTHWQSPNFFAFFPCSSSYPGILGDLYSAAFAGPNFNWLCSPAATELETIVINWLRALLSLPDCFDSTSAVGGGVIQTSASEAVLIAIVAARERRLRLRTEHLTAEDEKKKERDRLSGKLVALSSDQTHLSTLKGCNIAGVKHRSIVTTRRNGNYPLTAEALRGAIEEVEADGLEPFYITLSLGTTSTCAVDDIAAITSLLAERSIRPWVHVDAAYAGAALLLPDVAALYTASLEGVDSFDMNMHKWALTPFDCSCLYVRDRLHITDALSVSAPILRTRNTYTTSIMEYRHWQVSLGRRFRALKLWFVLRTHGAKGMREHVRRTMTLGERFAGWVRDEAKGVLKLFSEPAFGLTVCTVVPPRGIDREGNTEEVKRANEVTKIVFEAVNADGEVFLSSSEVDGVYAIRVVSGNPRVQERHFRRVFEIMLEKAREAREEVADGEREGVVGK